MADKITPQRRSYNMSRIPSKDTKPELLVRQWLHGRGVRFRIHRGDLPGKPDIVLPRYQTVVLVHGCFWHGHEGQPCFKMPSSRTEWWQRKLGRNKALDWQRERELTSLGWRVLIVWECELRTAARREERLSALMEEILQPYPADSSFLP